MAGASISKGSGVFRNFGLAAYSTRTFFYPSTQIYFAKHPPILGVIQAKLVQSLKSVKDSVWSGDVTNIELSVKQIGVAMKKLDKDFHLMANYIKDRDRNLRDTTRDIGVQTDFNLVSEMRAQSQTVCSVSHSELSTELEGAKLDIVLMESKIVCGFLTNTQKMEQIRVELVDQNKALSSKVEALELD